MDEQSALYLITEASKLANSGRARQYRYRLCFPHKPGQGILGQSIDYKPVNGKVLLVSDSADCYVVQEGRKMLFVAFSLENAGTKPALGDVVQVVPYERRRFDGSRLSDLQRDEDGAYLIELSGISRLPNKPEKCSDFLSNMIDQIERIRVDGRRTIAQMLIDAGACGYPVIYRDLDDSEPSHLLPKITFGIKSAKFQGSLSVILDRAADAYLIELTDPSGTVVDTIESYFDNMGEVMADAVDDHCWVKDRVTILKNANKNKAA